MEVKLVGPRAGQSCVLAGFDFVDGVARVPADASAALGILATYHSAYPRDSRDFEAAREKWEESQWKGASAGEAAVSEKDLARVRTAMEDLQAELEATRRAREDLEARLARAEGAGKGTSTSATEAPTAEAQEKAPKAGKAAK
ncbi:hypothetical protein D7Y04_40190 [Corallococcus sp. AB038B]|nr:hypothetical protein D7Y04_40190 [Corallococcus sp. AB038B]